MPSKTPSCIICYDWDKDQLRHSGQNVDVAWAIDAAKRGCLGCRFIVRITEPYMEFLEEPGSEVRLSFRELPSYGFYCYRARGSTLLISTIELECKLIGRETSIDPKEKLQSPSQFQWQQLEPVTRVSGYTGSQEAVSRARRWLTECVYEHGVPCENGKESQLPTRVLRIDCSKQVRLYVSSKEVAPYACLSHCWGKRPFIQTTTLNINENLKEIPWDDLPKTFQDAIDFTHGLGLEYLWIDSLCIIQDSIEDWRNEGSRMSEIYKNSYVTLSATKSANAYEGCFVASDKSRMPRTISLRDESSGELYTIQCGEELKSERPLHARGWAFQERLLSRRIIHFLEMEIAWECGQHDTCECSSLLCLSTRESSVDTKSLMCLTMNEDADEVELERSWERIVQQYSRRSLTYLSDIFPALQGLAKGAPRKLGRYLAGLWETTLPLGLCWFINCSRTQTTESQDTAEWLAPTWSWAATTLPVSWDYEFTDGADMSEAQITIVSARVHSKGTDPTGQLSHGEIVLRGECLRGEIVPHEDDDADSPWLCLFGTTARGSRQEAEPNTTWCSPYWDRTRSNAGPHADPCDETP